MKIKIVKNVGLFFCLGVISTVLQAAPNTIHFQGRLTDNQGTPIIGPDVAVKFSLYSLASGGTSVWDAGAEQSVATNSAGLFSTDIGPVPLNVFTDNSDLYLQVSVRGSTGLKILAPRQKLSSVPYAFQADFATYALSAATATFAQSVADGSITSDKIKDGEVMAADLAQGSVTSAALAEGSVVTGKIGDGQVTDVKISSISASKISGPILQSQIGDSAVGDVQLASGAVTDSKIRDVSANKITGTLGTTLISDLAVTDAKINDVSAGKISGTLGIDHGGTGVAKKMMNVVTYNGDGIDGRIVAHGMGQVPDLIMIFRSDSYDEVPALWASNFISPHSRTFSGTDSSHLIEHVDATNVTLGTSYVNPTNIPMIMISFKGQ